MSAFDNDLPLNKQKAGSNTIASLDRFGRAGFIERLAGMISESVSNDGSLVVSLEGPWGSGKTSAKNMLVEALQNCWQGKRVDENGRYPRLITVEFDPWLFSGSNDVVALMFSAIINSIDEYSEAKQSKRASAIDKIDKAKRVADIASNIDKTGILKAVSESLRWVSESMNPEDNNAKPLIQSRNELIRQLRLLPEDYAIVVCIDEIDRLDDADIVDLFKALKSVGDLPRVVYVPVFDREIIIAALGRISQQGKGSQYLEKIVQIPITLPQIPRGVIWKDFVDQIDAFTSTAAFGNMSQQNRYSHPEGYLLESCVKPFVHSARDMHRILNAFRIPALQLRNEVDLAELLCLTVIELYDPDFYDWIYWHRDVLLSSSSKDDAKENDEYVDSELHRLTLHDQNPSADVVKQRARILSMLFPAYKQMHFDAHYTNVGSSQKNNHPVREGLRRVSDPKCFTIYFRSDIGDSMPRQKVIDFLETGNLDVRNDSIAKRPETVSVLSEFVNRLENKRKHELLTFYTAIYPKRLASVEDDSDWLGEQNKEKNVCEAVQILLRALPQKVTDDFFAEVDSKDISQILLRIRLLQSENPQLSNRLSVIPGCANLFLRDDLNPNQLNLASVKCDNVARELFTLMKQNHQQWNNVLDLSQYALMDLFSFWRAMDAEGCIDYLTSLVSSDKNAYLVSSLFATSAGQDPRYELDTSISKIIPAEYLNRNKFSITSLRPLVGSVSDRALQKIVTVAVCLEQGIPENQNYMQADENIVNQWLADLKGLSDSKSLS